MFKTIIWATDGSEAAARALPHAKALAACHGGSLFVVHIHEIFVGRAGGLPVRPDEPELQAAIRAQVAALREEGFDATYKAIRASIPHAPHKIAAFARDIDADVIVVGTRGHAPLTGALLGSVTQRLLRLAPCPVLAVPASAHAAENQPERALAANVR